AERYCLAAERRRILQVPVAGLALPQETQATLASRGITALGEILEEGKQSSGETAGLTLKLKATLRKLGGASARVPRAGEKPPEAPVWSAVRAQLRGLGYPDEWVRINGSVRLQFKDAAKVTVTLSEAKALVRCLAHEQSLLLQSPPGVGKTAIVTEAAVEAGLPCRSLLGTQIAPEDVSGIPRIVGERSVFCPPRVLLPEEPHPFCLFLDELPACSADVQKAFYPLLLERRLGEHPLPSGSWVVAAGNRTEDRALVRDLSAALVNRLFLL